MADFIIYKPQHAGNIGMAVRALANLQMPPLHVVARRYWREAEVRKFAANAGTAVDQIVFHDQIESVYENYHVIVGTTAKPRAVRSILPLPDLGKLIQHAERAGQRTALLFGPEDVGLPNEITEKCDFLLTFTIQETVPVLNLAQMILLCAYEILGHQKEPFDPIKTTAVLAAPEQIHQFTRDLDNLLKKIEFDKSERSQRAAKILFRLIRRIALKDYELKTLRGMLRQLDHALGKNGLNDG